MGSELAEAIIEGRHAAGLSQAALARRAGISASYMSRVEGAAWSAGGPWPGDSVLRSLARALGLSSTHLVTLRRAERDLVQAAGPARRSTLTPYAVSVGPSDVDAAAIGVIEHNPRHGTLRSAHMSPSIGTGGTRVDHENPSYVDALDASMAADPDAMHYRVCIANRHQSAPTHASVERAVGPGVRKEMSNVRTRVMLANPVALDILIGDHEVMLAIPDRRGHPQLRAGIVVNDPDFVAAATSWFDESVWDPPCQYVDVRDGSLETALATIEDRLHGDVRAPSATGRSGNPPIAPSG